MISNVDELEQLQGVARACVLPSEEFTRAWDEIVLPPDAKQHLARNAAAVLQLRAAGIPFEALPLHGITMLVGPPGTGKTTLARGLADRVASTARSLGKFRFIEVDPHALMSSSHGRSQRAVEQLFGETIAATAATGPTVVLLDEVETLAADRGRLSLEANPVDVHRAVDAVLTGVDRLAREYPSLMFIATSNVRAIVDGAFVSRADTVYEFTLPNTQARERILRATLEAVVAKFPGAQPALVDDWIRRAAEATDGVDGRQLRKLVARAIAMRPEAGADPNRLIGSDLLSVLTNQGPSE